MNYNKYRERSPFTLWYNDLLQELHEFHNKGWTFEELIAFCRRMEQRRLEIVWERGLKHIMQSPCKKCLEKGLPYKQKPGSHAWPISVRSALYALTYHDFLPESDVKKLDSSWKRYRKTNNLGPHGYPLPEPPTFKQSLDILLARCNAGWTTHGGWEKAEELSDICIPVYDDIFIYPCGHQEQFSEDRVCASCKEHTCNLCSEFRVLMGDLCVHLSE